MDLDHFGNREITVWRNGLILFLSGLFGRWLKVGRAQIAQRKGWNKMNQEKKVTEPDIIERCILATGGVGLHQKCD